MLKEFAISFGLCFLLVAVVTAVVRVVAHRVGFVSKPRVTRWNTRTVALGGGIALSIGILTSLAFAKPEGWAIAPAILLIFILGLVDDIKGVPPLVKLVGQAVAAAYVIQRGYHLTTPWMVLSIALTFIWLVGISNAVNLLDNMDGLATGVTMVAASGLGFLLAQGGSHHLAWIAFGLAGTTAGFLVHNFNPARIFMGDSGSLVLGFLLALLSTKLRFPSIFPDTSMPILAILVLIVPLLDTGLVMLARRNARRPLMMGGRDHSSHRLVSLGLSERRAVGVLYFIGACGSALAWLLCNYPFSLMIGSLGFVVAVGVFLIFLLEVAVYPPEQFAAEQAQPSRRWYRRKSPITDRQHSLPLLFLYFIEIAFDVCLISGVWVLAHFLRFQDGGVAGAADFSLYMQISVIPRLPLLISIKLICFTAFRLYRGFWRTISVDDVYQIFKAVSAATILLVLGSFFHTRMADLSRMVVGFDWLLTFVAIAGIRGAMTWFRRWTLRLSSTAYRVAVIGTPGLAMAVRAAIPKNRDIELTGLIVQASRLEAEKILGMDDELERIIDENKLNVLYIADDVDHSRIATIASQKGVVLRRVRVDLG